jgi:small subunit ribosomal protein S6
MPRDLRAYELMIIVEGEQEDAAVDNIIERVTAGVDAAGGRIASVDKWGKRRFAYEINHKFEGHYVLLEVVASGSLAEVERLLRIADEVVRHKLFRLPESEATRRGLLGGEAPAA